MIEKRAESIAEWLIRYGAIEEEERDLYVFASCSFFMNLTPIFLSLLIGGIAGRIMCGVEIICPFMLIRKFGGGFHAKKPWMCLTSSAILLYISICIANYITYGHRLMLVIIITTVLLIIGSPIASDSREMDAKERKNYKWMTAILCVASVLISYVCFKCGKDALAKNIAIGIVLAWLQQIPCLLKKLRER